MAVLQWGTSGNRLFEDGIDRGVLYVGVDPGVPWNGLIAVTEKPTGGDADPYYIDGIKYANESNPEEYAATLEAYYSPPEFDTCDGTSLVAIGLYASQQPRRPFGLSYRTKIGNDIAATNYAYKIHIVYNAMAAPTGHNYKTLDDSVDPGTLSWDLTTSALQAANGVISAHFVVDTTTAYPSAVSAIEDILYGTVDTAPRLPTVDELIELFETTAYLDVVDNGDGTFTVTGPDTAVFLTDDETIATLSWPSVMRLDEITYQLSSL